MESFDDDPEWLIATTDDIAAVLNMSHQDIASYTGLSLDAVSRWRTAEDIYDVPQPSRIGQLAQFARTCTDMLLPDKIDETINQTPIPYLRGMTYMEALRNQVPVTLLTDILRHANMEPHLYSDIVSYLDPKQNPELVAYFDELGDDDPFLWVVF